MKLIATNRNKTLKELVEEIYWLDRVAFIDSKKWSEWNNIIISNTLTNANLYLEKFGIEATTQDSEPILYWESRSFSNRKLEYFNVLSSESVHPFYLT